MKFKEFAQFLFRLEGTRSRNEMTEILAQLLGKMEAGEAGKGVNLLLGQLAPNYEEVVFNIADQLMIGAIAQAYGRSETEITARFKRAGDLGEVAGGLAEERGENLSISDVFERFGEIAALAGEGSQEKKVAGMARLMCDLDPLGAKYAVKITLGKLRLGFSDKTIIDAISWAEKGDKSVKEMAEMAYQVYPDIGRLVERIKKLGFERATKETEAKVGVPIMPMLAQRLKSPDEIIKKMGTVAVEPKLDGLRICLHFRRGKNGRVMAFTRHLHDVAWMFPELDGVGERLKADEIILDSEAVGVDEKRLAVADFQTTMSRRRKHNIGEFSLKIPIKFWVFDVLLKDGKSMLTDPYSKRREVLERTVVQGGLLRLVESEITSDPKRIVQLNRENRERGMEGIMIKKADSGYVPGRTGWRWVKMKEGEEETGKLADTVDCVVMGYSVGEGKRAGFGLGQFLVGVADGEKIKTVCKVGTGLSDEDFVELEKKLSGLRVKARPVGYVVGETLTPDYWVKPRVVVEITGDQISKSPRHSSGLAIRFPRLVKVRRDKNADQATTLDELREIASLS